MKRLTVIEGSKVVREGGVQSRWTEYDVACPGCGEFVGTIDVNPDEELDDILDGESELHWDECPANPAFARLLRQEAAAEAHERAVEQGLGLGIDAYNDARGCGR